jgi:hypothetical protein
MEDTFDRALEALDFATDIFNKFECAFHSLFYSKLF